MIFLLASPSPPAGCVGQPNTNVIYPNFVTGSMNLALVMFTKWTVYLAKWVPLFATRDLAGPILISAGYFGGHREKSQTISVMSRIKKVPGMEIVAMIVLTIHL